METFHLFIARFLRFSAHLQMLPILESGEETTLIGGQAVMEGVMMRAPHSYCVAVRKPDGELVTEEQPIPRMSESIRSSSCRFCAGLGTLGQAMPLGMQGSEIFGQRGPGRRRSRSEKPVEISSWMMTLNWFSPWVFHLHVQVRAAVPGDAARQVGSCAVRAGWRPILSDGGIRIVIFLAFLFLLSRLKDIHRVFEYHGAEHKVVFNYESGKPVNVENAQKFVTFHPRCGTNFLFVVHGDFMLVLSAAAGATDSAAKLLLRMALLPLIAGLSYELIRFAAKRQGSLMGLLRRAGTVAAADHDQAA